MQTGKQARDVSNGLSIETTSFQSHDSDWMGLELFETDHERTGVWPATRNWNSGRSPLA